MKNMFKSNLVFKPASPDEIKAIGSDVPDGYIAGWASTTSLDSYDHVVQKNAFTESITKKGLKGPGGVKFLLNHDMHTMAGVIKVLEQRPKGLWMEAQMNLNVSYVKDAYELAKMNEGLNLSVGFKLQDYEFREDETTGEEFLLIKRGDLLEVSMVTLPANEDCIMQVVKSMDPSDFNDGEGEENGGADNPLLVVPKTIAEFQKTLVLAGFTKSRIHSKKLFNYIRLSSALFAVVTPEVVLSAPPLVDTKQLGSLSETLERMKQTLAAP
jgi:HK97 family phage prohead protease